MITADTLCNPGRPILSVDEPNWHATFLTGSVLLAQGFLALLAGNPLRLVRRLDVGFRRTRERAPWPIRATQERPSIPVAGSLDNG